MSYYFDYNHDSLVTDNSDETPTTETTSPSPPSSPASSSPSFSSDDDSDSSCELDPNDALQSPLTGLLRFEGFSIPHITKFNISRLDMPNLPSLPTLPNLRSFNIPSFNPRLPDLASNFPTQLQNIGTNMRNNFNMPNLSYLSQLTNLNTSAELNNLLHNLNLFRISASLPDLPQLPKLPQLPQLPQFPHLAPFFFPQFSREQLLKSWPQTKESVRNTHRRLSEITQRVPSHFYLHKWRADDAIEHVRIYFLLNEYIYSCDSLLSEESYPTRKIVKSKNRTEKLRLPDSSGVSPSTSSDKGVHQGDISNSKYEVLKFLPLFVATGDIRMKEFAFHPQQCRFVFCVDTTLYYYDDCPGKGNMNCPIRVETPLTRLKTDCKICPSNPNLVAYCSDGDIWCINLTTCQEVRLTTSHRYNNQNLDCDSYPVIAGRPNCVIREEFRRNDGFWWQHENRIEKCQSDTLLEYHILYEETDQSHIELITLTSYGSASENQRYPRVGKKNPVSRLKTVSFKLCMKRQKIYDISNQSIMHNLGDLYPESEYLVRAGWAGRSAVWCQLLNRRQTHLVVGLISMTNSFEPQIIYEESNDVYWVSVQDILRFLYLDKTDQKPLVIGSKITFTWCSEQSGFRHLYLIQTRIGTSRPFPNMIFKRQLTSGSWNVDSKDIWINENDKLIYFCGRRDTPLERHLYVLNYCNIIDKLDHSDKGRPNIHRLTESNFNQSQIAFCEDCSIYINIQSNVAVPPFGFVNRLTQPHYSFKAQRRVPHSQRLALFLVNSIVCRSKEVAIFNCVMSFEPRSITYDYQADLLPGLGKPELFCCQLKCGQYVYGSIFKPEFIESGVRYPTVLEVYGGPEVQLVTNNFMSVRQPTRHLLCSEGYVVVIIDCRGSGERGKLFEAHSFHRMGQVEIADQVEVLQWLAKNTDFIDLSRVAVKGWSYGGYIALMALAQYPDIFKIAIAGAPVTDWTMYDSAYTERFMGLLEENTEGYHESSVLRHINRFPEQPNRLLLMHGMMDENVHFSHTVALVKALVEARKPYDLQVFPTERHIMKSPASCESYMTYVLSYLQLNL